MTNPVDQFLASLDEISQLDPAARAALAAQADQLARREQVSAVTADALDAMLHALVAHDARRLEQESPQAVAAVLELLWRGCQAIAAECRATDDRPWPENPDLVPRIAAVYQHMGTASGFRFQLLKCLTEIGNDEALEQFAELLVLDPPGHEEQAVLAFAPLFQRPNASAGVLFPRLLDGLSHVQIAAPILDLANHLHRTQTVARHPAAEHVHALASLLGQVVQQLQKLTEKNPLNDPAQSSEQLKSSAEKVAAGSALTVALCDALGGIGNHDVVGSLYNALELPHRRIKTEAAAALARLDQPAGEEALRQLVEDPTTRFRALAYLEELGRVELVDEAFRTPAARAEGELALWLAEPTQFGWPPAEMELLDETTQYWPGFDQPQPCYLFRFTYRLRENELNGVGIAGPLVYAVSVDLADLPPADIYALYAGWQAEHAEISERAFATLSEAEQQTVAQQLETAAADQYEQPRPAAVGLLLGELHVIATASRAGT
ncbi:MAG: HEAT repeat domain-containing protein, partial [Pirellulales bacterium]